MALTNSKSLILFAAACLSFGSTKDAASESLEAAVRAEANKVAEFFKVSPYISMVESGGYRSQKGGGVSIDLLRLKADVAKLTDANRIYRLRWILAHEYWHQAQFTKYSTDFPSDSAEINRLFECQADLMGALYSAQGFPLGTTSSSDMQAFAAAYDAIAELVTDLPEDEAIGPGGHPEPEARGSAIYYGVMRAFVDRLEKTKSQQDVDLLANVKGSIEVVGGEDRDDWSYRLCQKIVHVDVAAASALALIDETPPWPKENFSGWFRLRYRNTSDRSIQARISVYLAVVEMNGSPSIPWPLQSKEFEFQIGPGAEQSISGAFGIDPLPGARVSLIYPRRRYAHYTLYSAAFRDPLESATPLALKIVDSDEHLRPSAKLLYSVLPDLSFDAKEKFSHFISGVCDNYGDEKRCPVSIIFPGSSRSSLVLEKSGRAFIDSDLYRGDSKEEAIKVLQALADDLKAIYPALRIPKIDPSKKIPTLDIDLSAHASLKVYFFEPRKSSDQYLVVTELYSTW
jgi:hypothetical protein